MDNPSEGVADFIARVKATIEERRGRLLTFREYDEISTTILRLRYATRMN